MLKANIRHIIRLLPLLPLLLATLAPLPSLAQTALRFEDMDGNAFDTGRILAQGKPVVFVFWQTWCPSCKKEAPELVDTVDELGGRVQFFGVISGPDDDIDDAKVRRTARAWGYAYPQVRDRDLVLARRFRVRGTPVIVVLGAGGRVLYRGHRLPADWSAYLTAAAGPAVPS